MRGSGLKSSGWSCDASMRGSGGSSLSVICVLGAAEVLVGMVLDSEFFVRGLQVGCRGVDVHP